jgi:hypothetical protein
MPRESTIQILRSTSTDTPTGLTFGELAYSDVNGKLFVGRTGGASLWVGTGITTGSISTNSATLVPTQSAVKTYVDGVVGGGSVVNSVNGVAGAITITGDGGSQLVTVSGTTTTFSNRLASATVTGVASFGNEFVVTSGAVGLTSNYVKSFNGSTGAVSFAVPLASSSVTGVASFGNEFVVTSGAVGLTSNYVKSINGSTGAVTNIAKTNVDNNFSASQTVGGIIASNDGDGTTIYLRAANADIFLNTETLGANQRLVFTTSGSNSVINLPGASGTVALVGTTVASVNGATGAITITGSGAITQTVSGTTTTFGARLASATVTGVASFGNEFVVTSGAVGLTSNYVKSFNGSTGAVSFAVPLASASVTGVASFADTDFSISATGNVTLSSSKTLLTLKDGYGVSDSYQYGNIITLTGSNGVEVYRSSKGIYTFRGVTASTSALGVASFNSTRFTVSGAGAVDLAAAFQVTGDTVVAGNAITTTRSGNSVTVDNNGVRSFNGATGAITITGAGAITYTQSGTSNTINARIASTSVTGVAYFDSTNFTAAGDGKVSITNGTITNTQLVNSSISFAGGGSPSSVSLGGTLTITGTANEVKVTNSGSGTLTLGLPTDVVIGGNLTVNGTVITANVENFIVEDPLIALGTGNAADSVDLGWYGMYTSGSLRYAGTFRDASDGGKFKFFGGLTAQPSAIIDTSAATYATATIVANIDGGTF